MAAAEKPIEIYNRVIGAYKKKYGDRVVLNSAFDIPAQQTQEVFEGFRLKNTILSLFDIEAEIQTAGEVDYLSMDECIASTEEDTDRIGYDPTNGTRSYYQTQFVNLDFGWKWNLLRRWQHNPRFFAIIQGLQDMARQRTLEYIAFNGQYRDLERVGGNTGNGAYVMPGILQKVIDLAPHMVLGITLDNADDGSPKPEGRYDYTIDPVKVGSQAGASYRNFNELTEKLVDMIDEKYRGNLKAIAGIRVKSTVKGELWKTYPSDQQDNATEQLAIKSLLQQMTLGSLQPVYAQTVHPRLIAVTSVNGFGGLTSELETTMAGISNLVMKTDQIVKREFRDYHQKSRLLDLMQVYIDPCLRSYEGMSFVHPDALQLWDETLSTPAYAADSIVWKKTAP